MAEEQNNSKRIAIAVSPEVHRIIRIQAIENDTTIQDLVGAVVEQAFGAEEEKPKRGRRSRGEE